MLLVLSKMLIRKHLGLVSMIDVKELGNVDYEVQDFVAIEPKGSTLLFNTKTSRPSSYLKTTKDCNGYW